MVLDHLLVWFFYKSCDFQTIVGWLWMIGSSNRGIVEGGGVCVQFFFWIEMSKRKASKFAIFLGNENPNMVLFIFFSQVQFFMGHFIKHKHFCISEEWLFLFLNRIILYFYNTYLSNKSETARWKFFVVNVISRHRVRIHEVGSTLSREKKLEIYY